MRAPLLVSSARLISPTRRSARARMHRGTCTPSWRADTSNRLAVRQSTLPTSTYPPEKTRERPVRASRAGSFVPKPSECA